MIAPCGNRHILIRQFGAIHLGMFCCLRQDRPVLKLVRRHFAYRTCRPRWCKARGRGCGNEMASSTARRWWRRVGGVTCEVSERARRGKALRIQQTLHRFAKRIIVMSSWYCRIYAADAAGCCAARRLGDGVLARREESIHLGRRLDAERGMLGAAGLGPREAWLPGNGRWESATTQAV